MRRALWLAALCLLPAVGPGGCWIFQESGTPPRGYDDETSYGGFEPDADCAGPDNALSAPIALMAEAPIHALAIVEDRLYFADSEERVGWMPLDGGETTIVAEDQGIVTTITGFGRDVFWTAASGSRVMHADEADAVTVVAGFDVYTRSVAADQSHVYWADPALGVQRADHDGIVEETVVASGAAQVALSFDAIYWIESKRLANGTLRLMRRDKAGGAQVELFIGAADYASPIAIGGGWVSVLAISNEDAFVLENGCCSMVGTSYLVRIDELGGVARVEGVPLSMELVFAPGTGTHFTIGASTAAVPCSISPPAGLVQIWGDDVLTAYAPLSTPTAIATNGALLFVSEGDAPILRRFDLY